MNRPEQKIALAQHTLNQVLRLTEEAQQDLEQMKSQYRAVQMQLTNKQVAALLGCSERTVIRMREDGRLKSNHFNHVMEVVQ